MDPEKSFFKKDAQGDFNSLKKCIIFAWFLTSIFTLKPYSSPNILNDQ